MAVVDDRFGVHGVQGLQVIEASIMPTIVSATAEDVEEIEANAFAANLLLPAQWIRLDVAGYTFDLENEARIDALADRYQVSKQAMIIRLTSLFSPK